MMYKKLLSFAFACLFAFTAKSIPLAGSYTIGGANPDYTTINAAITALDSNGVSAAVVFTIRNGNYPELLMISAVTGASAANTITFEGESADSSLVVINGATTSNQQNTVRLDFAAYIIMKNLTIKQLPNVNNNAALFINKGKYCTFQNCVIWAHLTGSSSGSDYGVQGITDTNMVFKKCWLRGGSNGNYFGNIGSNHTGLLIDSCYVDGGSNPIFIDKGTFAIVRNCTVGGRVLLQQTSRCKLYNNFFQDMLQSISSSGWPQQHMQIYNNVILGGSYQGAVAYGFWASSSGDYDFYNNTIYMNTPTMTGYAIYTEVYPGGINIKNNIIYRQDTNATNYIMRYPNAEAYIGSIHSDHNLFYRNGTGFTDNYSSLSAFTTGTGLDSNSVYADPTIVVSNIAQLSSYIASAAVTNTIGVPTSYINTDINGNPRHPFHPTVGAFESPSNVYCFTTGIDVQTECDSFAWMDGNTYFANTNAPTYTIIGGAANGCDSIVTLHLTIYNTVASVQTINSCTNYTWIDGNTYTASTNTPTYTTTSTIGCDSVITLNLTINAVDTSVVVGNASLLANASNATYQWLQCNGTFTPMVGDTNQTFTPTQVAGFYAVVVTQNGCTDTSACYALIITTSHPVAQGGMRYTFDVYPNPAHDVLNISVGGSALLDESSRKASISIQNTLGETICTKIIPIAIGNNVLETFDVSGFAKGVYFVKCNEQQLKFIKQ